MLNFLRGYYINTSVLCITLFCVSIGLPCEVMYALNAKEAAQIYNLQKLVKKLKDSKSKDPKKIASSLINLKEYIEGEHGFKFNMQNYLYEIYNRMYLDGYELSQNQMDLLTKLFKAKKIKVKNHAKIFLEEIERGKDFEYIINNIKSKSKKDDDPYYNINGNIVYGVSLLLAGFFLRCIPNPIALEASKWCLSTGATFIVCGLSDEHNKEAEARKKDEEEAG